MQRIQNWDERVIKKCAIHNDFAIKTTRKLVLKTLQTQHKTDKLRQCCVEFYVLFFRFTNWY